jgi:hypothetical protein
MNFFLKTLLIICLSYSNSSVAQYSFNYLGSSDNVPELFAMTGKERTAYELKTNNITKKDSKYDYYILSSYAISSLMKNGDLIFGDDLSPALNKFKNQALKDYPTENEKIKIVISNSIEKNAYCLSNGIVIVNLGLLASIKSEDELYSILCHEFSHYILNHSTRKYEYREKTDNILDYFEFSQKSEQEADSLGLIIYENLGLERKSVVSSFHNINRISYSFAEDSLKSISILEIEGFPFDTSYIMKSSLQENYEDKEIEEEYITHKKIEDRIKFIKSQPKYSSSVNSNLPSNWFKFFENKIKTQMTYHLLLKGRPLEALYNAQYLLQSDINKEDVRLFKSIAMYNVLTLRYEGNFKEFISYGDISGEYIFDKFSDKALTAITIAKIYEAKNIATEYKEIHQDILLKAMQFAYEEDIDSSNLGILYSYDKTSPIFWKHYAKLWLKRMDGVLPFKSTYSMVENKQKESWYGYSEKIIKTGRKRFIDTMVMWEPNIDIKKAPWEVSTYFKKNDKYLNYVKKSLKKNWMKKKNISWLIPLDSKSNQSQSYSTGSLVKNRVLEISLYPERCFKTSSLSKKEIQNFLGTSYIAFTKIESSSERKTGGFIFNHLASVIYPFGPPTPIANWTTVETTVLDLDDGTFVFTSHYDGMTRFYKNLHTNKIYSLLSYATK